ncbi:MAG: trigger factor [Candidatus Margulisbacteria bacterium]|nr:trigger factor [Candidatus Margulisiibacteriota bacterium]
MKIIKNTRKDNLVIMEIEENYSEFETEVEKAITESAKEMKLPGFRPGKAPRDIVEKNLNRDAIESHAAQELISNLYPKIIEETKMEPVDYPKIEMITLEKGKPIVVKIEAVVYPEVKLGRYKGIKVEKEKNTQSDEDVKNKLVAEVSSDIKADIPKAMVDREVEIMLDEFKASLAQSGLKLEDYLKGIKKEESAMKEELRKSAEIRVKGKLALRAVAEVEKIEVTPADIDHELQAVADQAGKTLEEVKKTVRQDGLGYIVDYLQRRKALDFLVEKAKLVEVESKQEKKEAKTEG